ncbi:hypothetical protein [Bradyrhizobium sp. LHD-71]|uniref:hypothetical protein n=1 Tax=Bradyrhizobium sp. LHD-71 TaxID=3072141 RepID=UPI00280EE267|nr:hypothetical protein [Bradyrhizobium sp. LHD-71]MDQ8731063.1 hypothetical protein [Bradyrhizobium sp. LHD-71]
MSDDLARMLLLTKAALNELASRNGIHWKEAVGELQSQYNEIVIWVLLYVDGDLPQTHAALCETLRPHMNALAPLQIVLFYEVAIDAKVMGASAFAAKLDGSDAVFSAGTDGKIDLWWFPLSSGLSTVFTARDSRRNA